MSNQGFPFGTGKSFPHPQPNGSYPNPMYYGQDIPQPYGQYGNQATPFAEQLAMSQVGAAAYGYGGESWQQHYRQQMMSNYATQAAYQNAQQNRASNPQQIADSVYSMTAQAYQQQHAGYQQRQPQLSQIVHDSQYNNQGSPTVPPLSVRTGPSPALSIHSPAGSNASMGERPMLSPHSQKMNPYNSYHHQTNQHNQFYGSNKAAPNHIQPHPVTSQPEIQPHPVTSQPEQPRSVERLTSISSPGDQLATSAAINQQTSPASTGYQQISPHYPNGAPPSACALEPSNCAVPPDPLDIQPLANHIPAPNTQVSTAPVPEETPLMPEETVLIPEESTLVPAEVARSPADVAEETSIAPDVASIPSPVVSPRPPASSPGSPVTNGPMNGLLAESSVDEGSRGSPSPADLLVKQSSFSSNDESLCSSQCNLADSRGGSTLSSQLSLSKSSSAFSRLNDSDESRLPPRKRKQNVTSFEQEEELPNEPSASLPSPEAEPDADLAPPSPVILETPEPPKPPKKRGRTPKDSKRQRGSAKKAAAQSKLADERDSVFTSEPMWHEQSERLPAVPVHNGKPARTILPKVCLSSPTPGSRALAEQAACLEHQPAADAASTHSLSHAAPIKPRRKPKASVSEMQKALLSVASSSDVTSAEPLVVLKRKRGRPLGSKNKIKEGFKMSRASAKPSAAMSKVTFDSAVPDRVATDEQVISALSLGDVTASTIKHLTVDTTTAKGPRKRRGKSAGSPRKITDTSLPVSSSPWVCVFCKRISNHGLLGDLYGGYHVIPEAPVLVKTLVSKKAGDSGKSRHASGAADQPNEVWFHEKCIVWAPGVHMMAGKLYGVHEAVMLALNTVCTHCHLAGAMVGCYFKCCPCKYHVACAEDDGCSFIEDNFSILCPAHKDKKIKLM